MVEEVSARLAERYDITIVTAKLRRDLPREDRLQGKISIVRVGVGSSIDKWLYPFLAPFVVRRLKPDIVHAVLESYAGLAMIFCRWIVPAATRVLTCQSTNTSLFVGLMHRLADRVTVISSALQKRAVRFGRSDALLIPNGVPYEALRDACARHAKVPGRILFVGRLEKMKGVDTLIRAIKLLVLQVRQSVPTMQLHIVGDGSQKNELMTLVSEFQLGDWIRFRGRLTGEDLMCEYAEAQVFAGLSRSEALGNVFLEAQAAGCAMVATDVGGIPDIISDGRSGLLVSANDEKAAADAIGQLLQDAQLRDRLAKAGIENARQYDWALLSDRYASVYDALFSRASDAAR